MNRYIVFTFKFIIICFFLFITSLLQFTPMVSEWSQSQSGWEWLQIKFTYPEVYERISENGQNITLGCTLDLRNIVLGAPFPFYKYEGSSSCGNTYVSLIGLLIDIVSVGALFWLIIRLLKKF